MGTIGQRLCFRYLPVTGVLALMGYAFAHAFLILHEMNGATPDPVNRQLLWRTPLTMAVFGLILLFIMEGIAYALRRKKPAIPEESLDDKWPSPPPDARPDA